MLFAVLQQGVSECMTPHPEESGSISPKAGIQQVARHSERRTWMTASSGGRGHDELIFYMRSPWEEAIQD